MDGSGTVLAMPLRARYAMSGTDLACTALTCYAARYAMSGTNVSCMASNNRYHRCGGCGGEGRKSRGRSGPLSPYAMSGTDIAYASISLRDVRY
eukprot:3941557-Rhodomonas_salina.4